MKKTTLKKLIFWEIEHYSPKLKKFLYFWKKLTEFENQTKNLFPRNVLSLVKFL